MSFYLVLNLLHLAAFYIMYSGESERLEVAKPEIIVVKEQALRADHNLEHETTVKQVFRNHPALVWWCFYWAMAAVGW